MARDMESAAVLEQCKLAGTRRYGTSINDDIRYSGLHTLEQIGQSFP